MKYIELLLLAVSPVSSFGFVVNNPGFVQNRPVVGRRGRGRFLEAATTSSPPTSDLLVDLDDDNFMDLLSRRKGGDHNDGNDVQAVLIDACATWCGPCKLIEGTVNECAEKWEDKGLVVCKLNMDDPNTKALKVELALQGVLPRSLPSLILFDPSTGKAVNQHTGVINADDLDEFVGSFYASRPLEEEKQESDIAQGKKAGFIGLSHAYDNDDYMLSSP